MKDWIPKTAGTSIGIALLLLVAACGGKQTVASKSAEAFREAQKKGVAAGGADHGGHTAATGDHGTATGAPADHATMSGMDHSNMQHGQSMAGMDHSNMKPGQSMAGMDHSNMKPGQSMAGMDHSNMKPGQSMAGMDHSNMKPGQSMAGMDHSSMAGMQQATPVQATVNPPTTNAEMQRVRPAATLKGDAYDAPAAVAVSEAMKASQGGGHEGMEMGGITPGTDRENPPTPAPAFRDGAERGSSAAPAMDHSSHGQTAPAAQPHRPQTAPAAETVYTCPMHPEVTSDKQGACPKCGMPLVKKKK